MGTAKSFSVLCRATISIFAASSAVTGYLLAPSFEPATLAVLCAGVLLLASGASALNQFQERDIDALMDRTRHRPLPTGIMTPRHALVASLLLIASGLVLVTMVGAGAAILGASAVLWYNGLYTPLKRRTAFAAVPGALVGVAPPAMGWLAGGGNWQDPKLFAIAMLFFLWQVPHFWLLLIRDRDGYARAGLPELTGILPRTRLPGIVVLWTACAGAATFALPLYGVVASPAVSFALPVLALATTAPGLTMLRASADAAAARIAFRSINLFLAALMFLLSIDPFLRRN